MPAHPVAWLVSTGRFKAIDRMRRNKLFVAWDEAAELAEAVADDSPGWEQRHDELQAIEDDRLRLVFTCCHPSLAEEAQIALTLREVCGLSTEAIASAFLVATPTLAQRIVGAKAKIAAARIPYEVPGPAERPARLASVLRVVYLVFNEGHAAQAVVLADEALRLARLLRSLMPEPEVLGLLALLLLHDARRDARRNAVGDLVPLEEQDRSLWNREAIQEGCTLAETALSQRSFGAYALQAAIAALHGEAAQADQTDWPQTVDLYDALLRIEPSPVVALNRAVAVAMLDGPEAGLALIEPLLPVLSGFPAAPAAAFDLCRRAGRLHEKAPMDSTHDLVITRDIAASRDKLYRCWTEPELIKLWFAPKPWTTTHAEVDLRVGGTSVVVMRGPDGQEFPNPGVYLELVPGERIVATDAYTRAWEPAEKAFMTLVLTFDDLGGGITRYTARARHWTAADREAHEKMGFHEGWGQCTSQLAELAASLSSTCVWSTWTRSTGTPAATRSAPTACSSSLPASAWWPPSVRAGSPRQTACAWALRQRPRVQRKLHRDARRHRRRSRGCRRLVLTDDGHRRNLETGRPHGGGGYLRLPRAQRQDRPRTVLLPHGLGPGIAHPVGTSHSSALNG